MKGPTQNARRRHPSCFGTDWSKPASLWSWIIPRCRMPSLSAKRSFAQSNMSKHVKTAVLGAECKRKFCNAEPVCCQLPDNPLRSIFHFTVRHVMALWLWCDIVRCRHLVSIAKKIGVAHGHNPRFFRKTLLYFVLAYRPVPPSIRPGTCAWLQN